MTDQTVQKQGVMAPEEWQAIPSEERLKRLQIIADEAAAWRMRYGSLRGGIVDRLADMGDPHKIPAAPPEDD